MHLRRAIIILLSAGLSVQFLSPIVHGQEPHQPQATFITTKRDNRETDSQERGYEALLEALDQVDPGWPPEQIAAHLFPEDIQAQTDVADQIRAIDTYNNETAPERRTRAVPAALVPYLAVLGRCVVGALGGAAVSEIVHYANSGDQSTAEARVENMVSGCISTVLPGFLRPIAERAKKPIAAAILAIIIRWNS